MMVNLLFGELLNKARVFAPLISNLEYGKRNQEIFVDERIKGLYI